MTIKLSNEAKQAACDTLPLYMTESLFLYFEQGYRPGSFLEAVLANDLAGAVSFADDTNKKYLEAYVQWLYWHPPGRPQGGWGSREAVDKWVEEANEARRAEMA